jgi:hypothetical protein
LRIASLSRLLIVFALFSLLLVPLRAGAAVPSDEAAKMLPDRVGDIGASSIPPRTVPVLAFSDPSSPEDFAVSSAVARQYNGGFYVTLVKTRSDAAAYALLTNVARKGNPAQPVRQGYVGTAGIDSEQGVAFFKGTAFVIVSGPVNKSKSAESTLDFARQFAETLDKGEGEIPVLVKHLPGWERAQEHATYAVSQNGLEKVVGHQPVLEAVSFEGGAEAVTSDYGPSRLVIVEYTTPQIATESDARITERIKTLQDAGQPVPSAYRRVGNYSVFVFDAPDAQTAAQLIDGISYEQVVQWLGANPHILERMQKEYVNRMGGTILAVIKASGLSLILCFGIGGLVGALVFKRRRAQAAAVEAYSDAGGMLRLNIDEITRQPDPDRLLGRGEG